MNYYAEYSARLLELRKLSKHENIKPINHKSKEDFFKFLNSMEFDVRRASLALINDGTLGATWITDRWRLSINFLGDEEVVYTLLERTKTSNGEFRQIRAVDLKNFDVTYYDVVDLREIIEA